MHADFLLYGSYGYTGRLIAERALEQGLRPLLAGRDAGALASQAAELGLEFRAFSLDDTAALDASVRAVQVVLHAAGPFVHTAAPMAQACIRAGVHYLDITGEIAVFEAMAALDGAARASGVMLMPGAGFDVVPTDCLAAHLARRLPGATSLALAFRSLGGGLSRGTATTMVENAGRGGAVRREGRIVAVPAAWRTRTVDFGRGPVSVTTIPWGDVSTAFHSTGIPDIEVYTRMSPGQRRMLLASRYVRWLLEAGPVQGLLKRRIHARPAGPSAEVRARSASLIWGEALDPVGSRVESRMRTPEGYTLTAWTSVAAVQRVLSGGAAPGYQTPSRAFGPDWILSFPGVERTDV